jgi:hypothetical protein
VTESLATGVEVDQVEYAVAHDRCRRPDGTMDPAPICNVTINGLEHPRQPVPLESVTQHIVVFVVVEDADLIAEAHQRLVSLPDMETRRAVASTKIVVGIAVKRFKRPTEGLRLGAMTKIVVRVVVVCDMQLAVVQHTSGAETNTTAHLYGGVGQVRSAPSIVSNRQAWVLAPVQLSSVCRRSKPAELPISVPTK